MAKSTINELSALVEKLHQERTQHGTAIAEIDEAFARLGISVGPRMKRGRRPGRPKKRTAGAGKKRRKRGTFKTTANELVLSTIRTAGPKGATGAQLSKVWKAAGRPGDAYTTLTNLAKARAIKRHKQAGERGSRYTLR